MTALLKEFIAYPLSTKVSVMAALVAIGSALWSGYFAWLARRRPKPIVEIEAKPREDWPGWVQVRAIITNPAPAGLTVDQVAVRRWSRWRIALRQQVDPQEHPENIEYADERNRRGQWKPPAKIPPQTKGHRSLPLQGVRVPANSAGRVIVELFIPPQTNGRAVTRLTLRFRYQYRDQLSKTKTSAAAVMTTAIAQ